MSVGTSIEDKKKRLGITLKKLHKDHGAGSVNMYPAMPKLDVQAVSTGSLGLDHALGVGGLARGRVVEIYGPESSGKTTLMLHAIAEVQKAGGLAAFIDAEHALDPIYAEALGVNMEELVISQPDNGEQALNIAEELVESGAVDIVVIDSVAALTPKAEIEGQVGDHHVGLQARMLSQACRKLASVANKTDTILVFINQIRMKIGVMFGCFQYNTRVVLADGSTEKIGKIVNQKLPVEVLSFDPATNKVSPKKVVNWFDNGKAEKFLQFVVEKAGGNGRSQFAVTENHTIFTPHGEVSAGDLEPGNFVLGSVTEYLTPLQKSVAAGSFFGDGSFREASRFGVQLRIGHGLDQTDYCRWKSSLLEDVVSWRGFNSAGGWSFDTQPLHDLVGWDFDKALDEFTAFAAAIHYLDDGSFSGYYERWGWGKSEISVKSFTDKQRHLLADRFASLGLGHPTVTTRGTLLWSGTRNEKLHKGIAQFVHPSMEYKLHPKFRGQFQAPEQQECTPRSKMVPMEIIEIYVKPQTRSMQKFDLEIEGNHTYLVDGIGVHNSPETTSGGQALKFYASQRIDIRRIGTIKQGDAAVGVKTRVKIVKNKVAPPFRQAEFDIRFGKGINKAGEVLDAAVNLALLEKAGSWYKYNGESIAQGRDAAVDWLEGNPSTYAAIEHSVRKDLGLVKDED